MQVREERRPAESGGDHLTWVRDEAHGLAKVATRFEKYIVKYIIIFLMEIYEYLAHLYMVYGVHPVMMADCPKLTVTSGPL